jgi:predicted nuclease with TOPRIM domain
MPVQIPEHELDQKRLAFVEWQQSEHFDIDDVDYETVEKFIETCSETMVPALVSRAVKAAVRVGCFRNDLAALRFVATAMEEETNNRDQEVRRLRKQLRAVLESKNLDDAKGIARVEIERHIDNLPDAAST